jgi:soluble lytic murein transglycosylase-like protein
MHYIHKYIERLYSALPVILSSAIVFGLFNIPLTTQIRTTNLAQNAGLSVGQVQRAEAYESPIKEVFFGVEAVNTLTANTIDKQMAFVASRKAYSASLAVIQKHEITIKEKAKKYGVPEDVALGVGLLENGGSETAKSPAGALGVFQLMPGTARSLGLTVNAKIDERRDPEKNIDAGVRYLALNYYRFGDWGLATWAYHAGEGNVAKAVQMYAKANHKLSLPGVKDPNAMRKYIDKYGITIHELLSDASVKTFTQKLKDDSSGYPYKVVATATLFKRAQ